MVCSVSARAHKIEPCLCHLLFDSLFFFFAQSLTHSLFASDTISDTGQWAYVYGLFFFFFYQPQPSCDSVYVQHVKRWKKHTEWTNWNWIEKRSKKRKERRRNKKKKNNKESQQQFISKRSTYSNSKYHEMMFRAHVFSLK